MQPRNLIRGCATAIVLLLVGFFACVYVYMESSPIDPEDVPEIERRAAPLIAAIDAYTAAKCWPPESLEQLVPDYLASIPLPLQGQDDPFRYFKYDENVVSPALPTWILQVWGWRGGMFSNEAISFSSDHRGWRYVPN